MKHFITLLFVITLCAGEMYAATPADSIRKEMKHLKGEKLLQAYHHLCRLAAAEDNMGYELRCIREYLAESLRQKDKEAEAQARIIQLYCYYNYLNANIKRYKEQVMTRGKKKDDDRPEKYGGDNTTTDRTADTLTAADENS